MHAIPTTPCYICLSQEGSATYCVHTQYSQAYIVVLNAAVGSTIMLGSDITHEVEGSVLCFFCSYIICICVICGYLTVTKLLATLP